MGAVKLLKLLRDCGVSHAKFAALAHVNRLQLHRVLSGKTVAVSVDFALAVVRASRELSKQKRQPLLRPADFLASTRDAHPSRG